MSQKQRIDPEVAAALDVFLAAVGPSGLNGIADIGQRRQLLEDLVAGVKAGTPAPREIDSVDAVAPGPDGASVAVRIYRSNEALGTLPGILYIHGGGMVMGSIDTDDLDAANLARRSGDVVVSVEYRLAPEHPFPAAVEDCYAALVWLAGNADELGIDPACLGLYGGSAGGGLAAAVALMARDRHGPKIAFQMLLSPMLDDRNDTASSHEILDIGVWDRSANLEAWALFLPGQAGAPHVSSYAAPARATDLSGLPRTYIDVGELDLFRDEDIEYAARLIRAGVPTELHIYPGGVHGSEWIAGDSELAARVTGYRSAALERALRPT